MKLREEYPGVAILHTLLPFRNKLFFFPILLELCLFACLLWTRIRKGTSLILLQLMAAPASVSRNWLCLLLCGWPTGSETRGVSRVWAWQTQVLYSAHEEAMQAPTWRHQMAPHFSGPSVNSLSLGFASWPKFLAEKRPQSGDSLSLSVTDRLKGTKPSQPLSEEAFGTSLNFLFFSPSPPREKF